MVERRVYGTTSCEVDGDLSLPRLLRPAREVQTDRPTVVTSYRPLWDVTIAGPPL